MEDLWLMFLSQLNILTFDLQKEELALLLVMSLGAVAAGEGPIYLVPSHSIMCRVLAVS